MKKYTLQIVLLSSMLLGSIGLKAQMNVLYADTLNKFLAYCQTDRNMQGVAAGVVFSDGSIWSQASGYAGSDPLSKNLLYDIGSNTKSMIATIILQLEEEGKLSLDDTLYTYLAPNPNISFGITLKQLLNHRSGTYSYTLHPSFGNVVNNQPKLFLHPDTILSQFMDVPDFTPGNRYKYSNTGYLLLGQVIEGIESKSLHQVLRDRIFTPNNMDSTFLDQYDTFGLQKAGTWFGSNTYDTTNYVSFMSAAWAAGGVVSTPKEFAQYAHKLFSGQLFSAASMQKMQTGSQIGGASTYGLGAIKWSYKGKTYLGHGGTTLQNSEMEYSIESDFSLVIMNIDYDFYDETATTKRRFLDLLEYLEETHASIGIEENELVLSLNVYPNPSSDYINLELSEAPVNQDLKIEVHDLMGRKVFEQEMHDSTAVLHKGDVGTGMFILRLVSNKGVVLTKQVSFN